ncbi:MAG: type II 3-dehydroquinate dehydratase [Kordiimonadaceae bacterium]|jgi:3-dehydroquinate dehydratase II|nr:type II 3-dehydroquinate dehydratase [Kordiimonadaceae bacterium]MBT6133889.1 type II 3-dehydroquinate dehydratase [Kordiimonadaceae bacterium]MBT6467361.1 type II 3-dehydroquinate dehydratase [Kordiimonadaceae bacterium]MBT7545667.1 type II 3-dehydroquinate dehydratase [Kordiimonadaceae bacterium]MBT7605576.1 type II 3-dehydroquinate dehydratase [Kordiimonadaceae bacterium]
MTKSILVINGPNLNLLGTREPGIYGEETLSDIEQRMIEKASLLGLSVDFRQSNIEGEIVNWIQEAQDGFSAIIINAGALTHTSVAIMDALLAVNTPTVEVHLSNIFKREEFRHHSYITPAAIGMITGFGAIGYLLAIDAINDVI